MSKHLKDFHSSAAQQTTPHPGVQAAKREDVIATLDAVKSKIERNENLNDADLDALCEILYLADVGNARGQRIGRDSC